MDTSNKNQEKMWSLEIFTNELVLPCARDVGSFSGQTTANLQSFEVMLCTKIGIEVIERGYYHHSSIITRQVHPNAQVY
jgi:hypothetical protein